MKTTDDILYPEIQPHTTGMLEISNLHSMYYEESGNPEGIPVVFIHGGPGGGCDPDDRQYFNPEKYRIILFDQRGCGKSTPHSELKENTTPDLVEDMEKLRQHLNVDQWLLFGSSWGSTLALLYAEAYPDHVSKIIISGIFLCRQQELDWLYQGGASIIWPDAFEEYWNHIPASERHNMISAYYKRLTSKDKKIRETAASIWSKWELSTLYLEPDWEQINKWTSDGAALDAFARIEAHYFVNKGFIEENQILQNIHRIKNIPCTIVQGRFDTITPIKTAWELHKNLPKSELIIAPTGAHSRKTPGMREALIAETDKFTQKHNA